MRVQAAGLSQGVSAADHALLRVWMPKFRGNGFRLVVQVAAAIGPIDIVKEDESSRPHQSAFSNEMQLVKDGIPVVIAIDQDAVESRCRADGLAGRKRVKAVALDDLDPGIAAYFRRDPDRCTDQ